MVDPVIIGTVALDSIETPFGKAPNTLGGSATYSSIAASFFSKPGIISIVGKDFPAGYMQEFHSRKIDVEGIQTGDKTFRWEGFYEFDMNAAQTRKTELNVLEGFQAEIPGKYKDSKYVFLGNIDPEQQSRVIDNIKNPDLIVMDTMNFWISSRKEKLVDTIKKVDVLVFNEGEARQLFNTSNLIQAGNDALKLVRKAVIIKKGEHGSLLFTDSKVFSAGSYPLQNIKDPTGCGDCFGGAFTGYLASTRDLSEPNMRKAVVYGSVIASYNAEGFGTENLMKIGNEDIESRFNEIKEMREF